MNTVNGQLHEKAGSIPVRIDNYPHSERENVRDRGVLPQV